MSAPTDVDVEHRQAPRALDDKPADYRCGTCGGQWPCAGRLGAITVDADAGKRHRPTGLGRNCAGCGIRWPCPASEREKGLDAAERRILAVVGLGWRIETRGGRIGTVIDHSESDEMEPVRTFEALTFDRGRPETFKAKVADLEPAGCQLPLSTSARDLARHLHRWLGEQHGPADFSEVRWSRIATRLIEGVF